MARSSNPFASCAGFGPDVEVKTVCKGQPHVVILGAGASRQACPQGDANGQILPLMKDLIDVVGLGPILKEHGIRSACEDFEAIYSRLGDQRQFEECRKALEKRTHAYFSELRLPSHPTIYDHLVLSLRHRDVIASFNWDPLLVQAAQRNASHVELPTLLFLHGNVAVGYCNRDKSRGRYPEKCPKCGNAFRPTRLLYPVLEKKYSKQPFIREEWRDLLNVLKEACILTIFGFGAPATDVEVVELLQNAWPSPTQQKAQWVELINITPRDDLLQQWNKFILSHHADTTSDFYESRIARHPRRTGEAWAATHLYGIAEEGNPLPRDAGFMELWAWFDELRQYEAGRSL